MIKEEANLINRFVCLREIKDTLFQFSKDKSPGPDGWTIEFFMDLFDLLGEDLIKVVEESRTSGYIP